MYIITGGAGFIGSAMLWELNRDGIEDVIIVDNLGKTEKWKNLVNLRYAEYLHRDDFEQMLRQDKVPWTPKGIIHMGACSATTELDADFLMKNNFSYSRLLCKFALRHRARFINASSAATYGDGKLGFDDNLETVDKLRPLNMYGYSKQLFDLWAKRERLFEQIISLKFFNVYGPNEYHKGSMMSVACKAYRQITESGKLRLFKSYHPDYEDGCQLRDFVYIKDCAALMWQLLQSSGVNGLFNVGCGQAKSWLDLGNAVFAAMGRTPDIEFIEMPENLRGKYQYFTQANMSRLGQALPNFKFTGLEEGVADYVQKHLAREDSYLEN